MFVEEIHYVDVGPIEKIDIQLMSPDEKNPRPIVFVGKNGAGKSILLSNIVDAFYEIAAKEYSNATMENTNGSGHQYYKAIIPDQIRLGQNSMFAHIKFKQDQDHFEYLCKSGRCSKDEYLQKYGNHISDQFSWNDEDTLNYKAVTAKKKQISSIFEKSIVCYFAPDRYSKPDWLGKKYYNQETLESETVGFSHVIRYTGILKNPITAKNDPEDLLQWLLDIIADSRIEFEDYLTSNQIEEKKTALPKPFLNSVFSQTSRKSVEQLLSAILGENIVLRMGSRGEGSRRFKIISNNSRNMIIPSLDALSTGQMALFNIFSTIIRYADRGNTSFSMTLDKISGVIVIDEIELHLHAQLQREVLPKLIKLFPQVQFIITTHSPLFLLGMQESFGDDGFSIFEMPSGNQIFTEQFSEFEVAYKYYEKTNRFLEEYRKAISSKINAPLIITEGATDWRHMKAARRALNSNPECSAWLPELEFEFLEYDPENSHTDSEIKIGMGNSELVKLCSALSKLPRKEKIIIIADRDAPETKQLNNEGSYKAWGNNVYSCWIPVPSFREQTPQISIEHYYKDEDLKREVLFEDGISRRMFTGNEFDECGTNPQLGLVCQNNSVCGQNRIAIIDGSGNNKVYKFLGERHNLALSKMAFAEMVLNGDAPFSDMDFSGFIPLYRLIKEILED